MEAMGLSADFWRGKRVLVTGHTGFKGSWLTLWLQSLGAQVSGFSLDPSTEPSLFELARVHEGINDQRGDLRDLGALLEIIADTEPEIVLHLAAQPLVREGYRDPLGTYSSNVMGTLNLLEAIRQVGGVRACVLVTTDKVYANQEWLWPYPKTKRWAVMIPTAAARPAANCWRNPMPPRSLRRKSTPSMVWRWPRRAPATCSAVAISPRSG